VARFPETYVPSCRLHRQSGQAIVTFGGRDHLLGPHNSPTSGEKYKQLIARSLLGTLEPAPPASAAPAVPTVAELVERFYDFADGYYQRAGVATGEAGNYRLVGRHLVATYGTTPATAFRTADLETLQRHLIGLRWARKLINRQVKRVVRMFKWASRQPGLYPAAQVFELMVVEPLKAHRTPAKELPRVAPVSHDQMQPVLAILSPVLRTMVLVQYHTGMRSGELVKMRPMHLDQSAEVWRYTLAEHKTEYVTDEVKVINIGPIAQKLLGPYLDRAPDSFVFSAAESADWCRQQRAARRKTPLRCGNRPGTNRKIKPARGPGDHFGRQSYRRAIAVACEKLWPTPAELSAEQRQAWRRQHHWFPHKLRHTAGTDLRRRFGIEVARSVLGQRTITAAQVYCELDAERSREAARLVG